MLLHLGGDWAANSRRIVAILDYDSVAGSRSTRKMLRRAEESAMLERIDGGAAARSIVILQTERGARLILSPISTAALKGRLMSNAMFFDFTTGPASRGQAGRKGK
jgi:hypothetical protein